MAKAIAAFLILLVAAPAAVFGADIIVGGDTGWDQSFDYGTWAAGQKFTVGDVLVFNYAASHEVDEVTLADYNSCSSSNPLKNHQGGTTKITLATAGLSYYTCPTPGHCASGQKLMVTTVAAGTPAGTPPPTTTPSTPTPTPGTPTSTPPTTPVSNNSPPPPPPPPNAAAGLNMRLVGVPLVLAALIAVMG